MFAASRHAHTDARARPAPPVCLREKMAATAVGLLIIQLPWFLGGISIPAQFVNLALALLALATLFVPLKDPLSPTPLDNLKNLLKFPVFWLGLVFLAYLLAQYFNPHIEFTRGVVNGERMWWVQPVPHITWLPSGLESPYYPMNALRFFVMWCTPLLLMCVCKLAIRRRRTWYALLWVTVLNACVLCIVGFAVRAGGSNLLLWIIGPMPSNFFASFVYPNHAGIFLYLNLAVALALFLHLRENALLAGERSGKYWLSALPVLLLAFGGFATGSRIGLSITLALLAAAAGIMLWSAFLNGGGAVRRTVLLFALLAAFAFAGFSVFYQGNALYTVQRLETISTKGSLKDRLDLIKVSSEVARDRLLWGWGAGSFAYVSQPYLKKVPAFQWPRKSGKLGWYLAHCHCDWIEFPSDLGLLGCLPLAGIGIYWAGVILRRARTLPPEGWILLAGVAALAVHAVFDFPMSAPAVQMMLALLLCATALLAKASAPAKT